MAKKKRFKLNYKIKEGKIILDRDSFEHILLMISAQKHVNEKPCVDVILSDCEFKKVQSEMQQDIDDIVNQGADILAKHTMLNAQVV